MHQPGKVAASPGKPLMIYDGDCRFCTLWIRRWNQMTGDKVDYLPFQDESVSKRFPELARVQFEAAVHLIETDGSVYYGAEAVFRSLAYSRGKTWLLKLYQHSWFFAKASEKSYAFVARHRVAFSALTRFAFGKHVEQPNRLTPSEFIVNSGQCSLEEFLAPLRKLPGVQSDLLGQFEVAGENYSVPRFLFRGPNSSDPIRIGIFAMIHGDEPAGALACARLLQTLAGSPALAENFSIRVYPVCNPTGFEDNTRHSRSGRDLNREFWKASAQPEVRLLEQELRARRFQGIIQLHADDTSEGIYGFVRGATLTENLLRPALLEAGKILPLNENAQIDGFAARDGIIHDHYEGVLGAPAQLEPTPFEIILETPHHAPMELQVEALDVAIRTILTEYRHLISFAQDI